MKTAAIIAYCSALGFGGEFAGAAVGYPVLGTLAAQLLIFLVWKMTFGNWPFGRAS